MKHFVIDKIISIRKLWRTFPEETVVDIDIVAFEMTAPITKSSAS